MNENNDYDVVIIGGGVGGLTLALKLVQRNIRTLVIEKDANPGRFYKGELLQPKSLEGFDDLGVINKVIENSHPLPVIHQYELNEKKDGSFEEKAYIPLDYSQLVSKYPEARMVPHEELKEILKREAEKYPSFTMWHPASFRSFEENSETDRFRTANVSFSKEKTVQVTGTFFVGAEGRASKLRGLMNKKVDNTSYNHHFLTVSFERPADYTEARIIATHKDFLGIFPLPDNQVRTVVKIAPGDYKKLKNEGLSFFYEAFEKFEPRLLDGAKDIPDWRKIQLMIPVRQHLSNYVHKNIMIIGDAAHTVHPMAGEGMNLAIQDALILGDLLSWMLQENLTEEKHLMKYERIRKKRAFRLSFLSHLGALGYSTSHPFLQRIRIFGLKRLGRHPVLHYKHILNISGIGWWPYSFIDIARFFSKSVASSKKIFDVKREWVHFKDKDDYPWRYRNKKSDHE